MKKENITVIIAIVLPVILILVVAAFVYFPNAGTKQQYSFLYIQNSWPYAYSYSGSECTIYNNYYEIEGNHLAKRAFVSATSTPKDMNSYYDNSGSTKSVPAVPPSPLDSSTYCYGYSRVVKKDAPDLYIYSSIEDSAKVISYDDANKLVLVDGVISPDGYSVGTSYESSGILDIFGGGDSYGLYAMKKNKRVRLSVPQADVYNIRNFGFLAWVSK